MDPVKQFKNEVFSKIPSVIYRNRRVRRRASRRVNNLRLKKKLIKQIATIMDAYMVTLMCIPRDAYHNDSKYQQLMHDYKLSKKYSAHAFVEDLIYLYDRPQVDKSSEEAFVKCAESSLSGHDLFQTVNDSFEIIRCLCESTLFDGAKISKIYVEKRKRDSGWSNYSCFLAELEKLSLARNFDSQYMFFLERFF